MSRSFALTIPCPTDSNPPYGTFLYSSCQDVGGGQAYLINHYADGNGGEYTENTLDPC